jgi:hypothetical protein
MSLWSAIPAVANIASSLLGGTSGGETVSLESSMPDWQSATGKQLSEWIQKYMNNYVPGEAYTGKLSAGMTGQEATGLDILNNYLSSSNVGSLFNAGKTQIADTLAGKYMDPNTSPYIKAMKQMSNQDLADAINTSRIGSGARGNYYSTAAIGEEKDLTSRNLNNLNTIIGNYIQNERQNMLGAATTAQSMDQYENVTAPLSKVSASQSLGSLSRVLEQEDLERQYSAWKNQRTEAAQPISAAQSLYGTNSQYGINNWTMPQTQTSTTSSDLMKLLSGLNWNGVSGTSGIGNQLLSLFS